MVQHVVEHKVQRLADGEHAGAGMLKNGLVELLAGKFIQQLL